MACSQKPAPLRWTRAVPEEPRHPAAELRGLVRLNGEPAADTRELIVRLVDGKAHLLRLSFVLDAKGSLLVRSGLSASDVIVRAPSSEIAEGAELGAAAAAH